MAKSERNQRLAPPALSLSIRPVHFSTGPCYRAIMVMHTVLVQITGATQFLAEVEVDTDDLEPETPPTHLTGTFTRFDGYEAICKSLVHADPL